MPRKDKVIATVAQKILLHLNPSQLWELRKILSMAISGKPEVYVHNAEGKYELVPGTTEEMGSELADAYSSAMTPVTVEVEFDVTRGGKLINPRIAKD